MSSLSIPQSPALAREEIMCPKDFYKLNTRDRPHTQPPSFKSRILAIALKLFCPVINQFPKVIRLCGELLGVYTAQLPLKMANVMTPFI